MPWENPASRRISRLSLGYSHMRSHIGHEKGPRIAPRAVGCQREGWAGDLALAALGEQAVDVRVGLRHEAAGVGA